MRLFEHAPLCRLRDEVELVQSLVRTDHIPGSEQFDACPPTQPYATQDRAVEHQVSELGQPRGALSFGCPAASRDRMRIGYYVAARYDELLAPQVLAKLRILVEHTNGTGGHQGDAASGGTPAHAGELARDWDGMRRVGDRDDRQLTRAPAVADWL